MVQDISRDNRTLILVAEFPRFTPLELFDYFVEPRLLVQWWPAQAETQAELGGAYQLSWPAMGWLLRGRYTRFEPGERLAFTWNWDHEPDLPERQVEVSIEPNGEGSRLTLTHGTYADTEVDRADRQSHLDGWRFFLPRLSELGKQSDD